tara:strand:- start:497 stop:1948 length:1452 start_codon:yes stop_codon:yes gene_type:complete
MSSLKILNGPKAGITIELSTDHVVMGRADDCTLIVEDDLTSGHHAEVARRNDGWWLRDLDSANGTLVDGKGIKESILGDGDVFVIGGTEIQFRAEGQSTAGAAPEKPAVDAPVENPTVEPPPVNPPAEPVRVNPAPQPPLPEASADDVALVERMSGITDNIRKEVAKVIIGQRDVIDQVMMCMLAGGHSLLIGLPGLAKTLMISTIARVVDLEFKRIQFTPDLMPSDITGTEILETNRDTNEKEFRFLRGPIFCNLLLADEINRTPPKTQAALLEAMQEKRVTAGNVTYDLEPPFFVLATQNPIEQEGTYPLPEAQMDRFMFNIWVDYPSEEEEELIVSSTTAGKDAQPDRILTRADVMQLQDVVRKVPVSPHVVKYAIRLVRASRPDNESAPDFIKEFVSTGAGPRAGQYLILAAKARAVMDGRIHLACNDIRSAAIPVLRHRIYTNFAADSEGLSSMDLVNRLLDTVEEPSEKDYGVSTPA